VCALEPAGLGHGALASACESESLRTCGIPVCLINYQLLEVGLFRPFLFGR